jgi:hypothetical protein
LEDSLPIVDAGTAGIDQHVAKPPRDAAIDASMDGFATPLAFPFHPGEHWIGTYTCPQGLTKLDLAIVSTSGNDVTDAVFNFDWGSVTGSFHLSGTFDPPAHAATFQPGAWIVQPNTNWYTVGMTGTIDETTMTYAGDILGQGCGTFSLVRM